MLQKPTADTRFCTAGAQTSLSKPGLFKIHVCLLTNKYRGLWCCALLMSPCRSMSAPLSFQKFSDTLEVCAWSSSPWYEIQIALIFPRSIIPYRILETKSSGSQGMSAGLFASKILDTTCDVCVWTFLHQRIKTRRSPSLPPFFRQGCLFSNRSTMSFMLKTWVLEKHAWSLFARV
jgi:hypothetical protein